jgi:hypothetical protein
MVVKQEAEKCLGFYRECTDYMYIENSGSPVLVIGVFFCGFLACILVALGWCASHLSLGHLRPRMRQMQIPSNINQPLPLGKLIALACYAMALTPLLGILLIAFITLRGYDRLAISDDGKALAISFPLQQNSRSLSAADLKSVKVEQEYVSGKRIQSYYSWKVIPEEKNGNRYEPNWTIRLTPRETSSAQFRQLEGLITSMEEHGWPLEFTFKDYYGQTHNTESLLQRPNALGER